MSRALPDIRLLTKKTRWMSEKASQAFQAIRSGNDPQPFLDDLNAIVCGKGTWFYLSQDQQHICVNIVARFTNAKVISLPAVVRFTVSKITAYHPNGRAEVVKDLTGDTSKTNKK